MINRKLARRIELLPDEEVYGLKIPIELEYYLLESEIGDVEELEGKKAYGIEIIKKINQADIEKRIVRNFSCCRQNTESILDKLATNSVTPMALPFILDDMIGV